MLETVFFIMLGLVVVFAVILSLIWWMLVKLFARMLDDPHCPAFIKKLFERDRSFTAPDGTVINKER